MSVVRRLVACAAGLAMGLGAGGCEPRHASGPNVLVVIIDTLRSDRLGSYGHTRDTSPAIDALAAAGVVFDQAITAAPRTWQSFTSILTGLYPPRHGVRFIFDKPLAKPSPTLASVLARAGYRTAAFDGITFLRGMTGGRSFQEYFDSTAGGKPLGDQQLIDVLLAWPGLAAARPFFAFVRLGSPHWPYACEQHFHKPGAPHGPGLHAFNAGSQGLGLGHGGLSMDDAGAYRKLMYGKRAGDVYEHMLLHYDECVRTSDRAVGRVIARLQALGKLDSTLVVVTADHGESFGEHGYNTHGPQVDEPVMRVPLVMRFPAGAPATRRGARVAQQVRTVDIFPTIVAALGLSLGSEIDGVSLLPAVDDAAELGLTAYGESGRGFVGLDPDRTLPGVAGKLRMLRTARWKLVHVPDEQGGSERLYDLAGKGEAVDVASQHPEVVASLRAELGKILIADTRAANWKAPNLSDEQKARLHQLGYL